MLIILLNNKANNN